MQDLIFNAALPATSYFLGSSAENLAYLDKIKDLRTGLLDFSQRDLFDMTTNFLHVDENIICFKNSIYAKTDLKFIENAPIGEEFIYIGGVVQGDFAGAFEDKIEFKFNKFDIFIGKLTSKNGYMCMLKDTRIDTLGIIVRKTFLENIPELKANFADNKSLILNSANNIEQVLLQNIFYSLDIKDELRKLKTKANILELVHLLLNRLVQENSKKSISQIDKEKLLQAKTILEQGLKAYSVKDLASLVGLNEYKLKTGFKQVFNASVHQMSLDYRLQTAKYLLKHTTKSLGQISEDIGFKHQQTFTTAFKRKFGILPTQFRY